MTRGKRCTSFLNSPNFTDALAEGLPNVKNPVTCPHSNANSSNDIWNPKILWHQHEESGNQKRHKSKKHLGEAMRYRREAQKPDENC